MQKSGQPLRQDAILATRHESTLRCGCGNLLARVIAEGVELKCRRCKRCVVVPLDAKGTVRLNM